MVDVVASTLRLGTNLIGGGGVITNRVQSSARRLCTVQRSSASCSPAGVDLEAADDDKRHSASHCAFRRDAEAWTVGRAAGAGATQPGEKRRCSCDTVTRQRETVSYSTLTQKEYDAFCD